MQNYKNIQNQLKTIKIGSITLSSNVILAPMSGVSDKPYRDLVENFTTNTSNRSVGMVVSEMVASDAMKRENEIALKKADITDSKIACVQLAGYDPDIMAETAKMCENNGAQIIDINYGCPAKKITNNYSGSALMRDIPRATAIIQAVVNAVKIPVTVKMRTGWDDNSRNAPELAKIAEDLGVHMITVHGRTRCQFYTGKSDWQFIKNVVKNVNIPVIVNGDIINYDTAIQALIESEANGIMIGRGAYGKPWLPAYIASYIHEGNIEKQNSIDLLPIVKKHFINIINYYGENQGIKIARKHLGWYSKSIPNAIHFRTAINTSTCYKTIIKHIEEFFTNKMV
ncbi:MAG: tRNA dihydrouridine synthase DusB [Pseudomonadota bacterium]